MTLRKLSYIPIYFICKWVYNFLNDETNFLIYKKRATE